ncbi:hypothetical protein A2Y99_04550 [Candidatus Gottesmanbacteria bacterium RBG_13_37_7]|uniref:Nudix hydrolase domain-containing protein n=1 Tax=Candidatus Gottesmanbacteria bacterium RBG_13_37_7 TaxID=1798369 RepID=A0A1F5YGC5_9BACT|nr:MAG: hypothetical protein A2Y99_04550 [Candidatus Gottesmanbacteria bacterium RBG_13_37_7]
MKTTDNLTEVFDIVDEKDRVIGRKTREEVHKDKNFIHRSIAVAVFNSRREIYLQQRSTTKDMDPLLWTISCSGHVLSGDSYEITAHRELIEELGVDLQIEPVAKYLCSIESETEMIMLFKASYDGSFVLNKKEIIQGAFIKKKELGDRRLKSAIKLSHMGKIALEKLEWL